MSTKLKKTPAARRLIKIHDEIHNVSDAVYIEAYSMTQHEYLKELHDKSLAAFRQEAVAIYNHNVDQPLGSLLVCPICKTTFYRKMAKQSFCPSVHIVDGVRVNRSMSNECRNKYGNFPFSVKHNNTDTLDFKPKAATLKMS